jgi:hypothetical protein
MRVTNWLAMAITPFILNATSEPEAGRWQHQELLNQEMATRNELPPAATDFASVQDQEVESQKPSLCQSPFHVMHFDVRHTESKGVGYKNGYTTLEGFGIYDHNPYLMPFLDLRAHVFNNGKWAGNVGLGERTVIPSINHVFGLYCYYDIRQEDHGLTVNQISPGVELLGKRMEYRINGYFPVGRDESRHYDQKFKKFQGHRILIQEKKKYAMTGADTEVGAHITQSTQHDVYGGVGAYYFTAAPASLWGGKARLFWRYKEYISLEASYSYDRLFKNVFQGTIGFSCPLGNKIKRKGRNCPNANDLALSRAAFAPYRFEIPVVSTRKQTKTAINPLTGQPWTVWFVNNTSHSAGTFESPFPTLSEAQTASGPHDIVYVFPGNGSPQGMNVGITLQDNQALYGAGNVHDIHTTRGRIHIPAFSSTAPLLTNVSNILNNGNIVNLANNNEVSGMNLLVTQSGSSAINGSSNIYGTNINHNTILGNVDHNGIFITGSGPLDVSNNQVTGIFNSTSIGIFVKIEDGLFAKITVTNNICSGYLDGIDCGPSLNPTTSTGDITISGNLVSSFKQTGIFYPTGMANSIARLTNNTVLDNVSIGGGSTGGISVSLNTNPDSGTVFINNNTVMTTTPSLSVHSIAAELNIGNGSSAEMFITDNTIQVGAGAGSIGINMTTAATNTLYANIVGNQFQPQNPAGTTGINIAAPSSTIILEQFSNNSPATITFSGNVILPSD